jgi:hypothetical protein
MTYLIPKSTVARYPKFEDQVAQHVTELNFWAERERIVAEEAKTPFPARPAWEDFGRYDDPAMAYSIAIAEWEEKKLKRHDPIKRPQPNGHIESCVRKDGELFVADYEIINDDPTPDQVLQAKKAALIQAVTNMELQQIESIAPPVGKRRMINFRLGDIAADDENRMRAISKQIADINDGLNKLAQTIGALMTKHNKFVIDQRVLKEQPDAPVVLEPFTDQDQIDLDEAKRKIEEGHAKVRELSEHIASPDDFHAANRPAEDHAFLLEQKQRKERAEAVMRKAAQAHSDIEDLTIDTVDAFEIPTFENREGAHAVLQDPRAPARAT